MLLHQNGIDPAQLFSWKVTAWVAMVTATVAIWQAFEALRQRKRDARARQAALARELHNEIFAYAPSNAALDLLDEDMATFDHQGQQCTLLIEEIERSLSLERADGRWRPKATDPRSKAMRRCFDALFYYFDRFDRFVEVGVLKQEDVETPWAWYTTEMVPHKKVFVAYAQYIGYPRALTFMDNFEIWRTA